MIIPLEDGETLSRLFHLNSEPWSNVEAYRAALDYEVQYKEMAASDSRVLKPWRTSEKWPDSWRR